MGGPAGRIAPEKGSAMSLPVVTVEGIIKPDGTLEIAGKVDLPAGQVQVTLVPLSEPPQDDPFWRRMQAIREGQRARGHAPRDAEGIESGRQALRQEMEDEIQEAM